MQKAKSSGTAERGRELLAGIKAAAGGGVAATGAAALGMTDPLHLGMVGGPCILTAASLRRRAMPLSGRGPARRFSRGN